MVGKSAELQIANGLSIFAPNNTKHDEQYKRTNISIYGA